MANKDYYQALGIRREATADEIKQAYRKRAREYHPDLHPGDKQAEAKFKEIQEAYDVLGDPDKRDQYDRFGAASFEQGAGGPRNWSYQWSGGQGGGGPRFEFAGGDFGGFEDILGEVFGARGPRRSRGGGFGAIPGEDIETEVRIPFQTAASGGNLDITLSGAKRQRLSITIPPGVNDGARLRLAGKGNPSPAGGKAGDLFVHVRVDPHPYFTRKGHDVYLDVPITVAEALLGATIDVPTLSGTATVTIPPGTSSGQKLRLRGKGCPRKDGGHGNQYVQVKVVVPKSIDEESKQIVEQFSRRNPMNPRAELGW